MTKTPSNGGIIGVDNAATFPAAPGSWSMPCQMLARSQDKWPTYLAPMNNIDYLVIAGGGGGGSGGAPGSIGGGGGGGAGTAPVSPAPCGGACAPGTPGTTNLGGGGGGSTNNPLYGTGNAGNGGSGIVILRYAAACAPAGVAVSPGANTITTAPCSPSHRLATFTVSGTFDV